MPSEKDGPETRYLVVGLTDEGEEVRRITVVESRLAEARAIFAGFSDWVDVFRIEPGGLRRLQPPPSGGG